VAILSATGTGVMAIVDPEDLSGLNPTALLTVVTLTSLGVMVYFFKSFVRQSQEQVREIAKQTAITQELCARLNVRPCLFADHGERKRKHDVTI